MIPVDPVQVLGFVGFLCVFAAARVGAWIAAMEFCAWRRRRARRRARVAVGARRVPPRAPVRVLAEWSPEWGWPPRG
jgi:hypothetical protein